MAIKISALPSATLPFGGGEVFPIVQSGATRQAPISSLSGGGSGAAVLYTAQSLLSTQQGQARTNIGITFSQGTSGTSDVGKVPIYGATGTLASTRIMNVADATISGASLGLVALAGQQIVIGANSGFQSSLFFPTSLSANYTFTLPKATGTVPIVPTFADDAAAAGGGLNLGDIYYNGSRFRARMT